jgi:signal transduction histidine kinase/DNA-binding NarL/FixJ family response regulator
MTTTDLHAAKLLLVDDEQANLDLLEAILAADGFRDFTSTRDPHEAVSLLETLGPDVVLLDLLMAQLFGFGVLAQIGARVPAGEYLPVLVLTAAVTPEARQRALSEGAHDFLTKPFDALEVVLRIRNLLETRRLHRAQQRAREQAEAAERRARLLAEAGRVLASSCDYPTSLAQLARVCVPELGDCCVVDVLEADDAFVQAGAAHVDPAREVWLHELARSTSGSGHSLDHVFRRGEALLVPEVTTEMLDRLIDDATARATVERLEPRSAMIVPIRCAQRLIGGITLLLSASARRYTADDLALAETLAERAALAIENARLYLEAQQATRARDELLAVVAHDLRNPLNTILMATEMVRDAAPIAQRPAEIALRAAERMSRLIEDLLDVARLQGGGLTVRAGAEPVSRILDEAMTMLQPLAAAQGIAMERADAVTVPAVRADASRILQLISNLAGNAIKFTPVGGRITLGALPHGREVLFWVADTGPGIAAEQIPHIFSRFWQVDRTDRRGVGLGLAIARGIAEAHGGRIWVESRLGEGSTFFFTVPVAVDAATADFLSLPGGAAREAAL